MALKLAQFGVGLTRQRMANQYEKRGEAVEAGAYCTVQYHQGAYEGQI
jgi:hypothetical protein